MHQHDRHAPPHRSADGDFDSGARSSPPTKGASRNTKCKNASKPKVELARVTCEKERRHREKEARLEKQRLMEAERNKVPSDANFFLKII